MPPINTTAQGDPPFVRTGLSATGSTMGTALELSRNTYHEFTSVPANAGALLPEVTFPSELTVQNSDVNALVVYPRPGGTINGGAANTPFVVAPGTGTVFWASSFSNWYQQQTPGSGGGGGTGSGTVNPGTSGTLAGYLTTGAAVGPVAVSALQFTSSQVSGLAPSATLDTTDAGNITKGKLPAGQLPAPTLSALGGVLAVAAAPHAFMTSISPAGNPVLAQPAFTDVQGVATPAQIPTTGLVMNQHVVTTVVPTGTSGTVTLDLAAGDLFVPGAMTGNVTLALTNPPTGGRTQTFRLIMQQAASGGPFTLGYFSNVTWIGSSAGPAMSTTPSAIQEFVFTYILPTLILGHFPGVSNTDPAGGAAASTTITEVSQTASFTAVANSFYAISGSANVTATLPTAAGIAGQTVRIRCVSGYTGLCTIASTSSQTIGPGAATSQILHGGESALLQSDGVNWVRTGGTIIPCMCRLYMSIDQSIPQGADTLVQLNQVAIDNTGQMAVTGSNQIKIFRPGTYRATGGCYYNSMSNQSYTTYVNVSKNAAGGPILFATPIGAPGTAFALALNATGTQIFAAGDLVTLHVLQANAGNIAQTISGGTGSGTSLEIEEIPAW